MFARPFDEFDPKTEERVIGDATRTAVVARVDAPSTTVDCAAMPPISATAPATCQGLALQETAGWLGTTTPSRNRRWAVATDLLLAPPPTERTR